MKATEENTARIDETIDRVKLGAHEAVDKMADATSHAAETLGQKSTEWKNAEQQFMENCRNYMNEKPMASLAMAVGAGFLLSRLMSGR